MQYLLQFTKNGKNKILNKLIDFKSKKTGIESLIIKIGLLSIIVIHILLLSKMIFFPYPELFVYPYLTKIGLVPYKDIFDQHFPGLMFFPINLATLGIDTPDEMRLIQYVVVILSQILIFLISRKIFNSERKAICVNLLFFLWHPFFEGYVLWIDSFSALIALVTFYFNLKYSDSFIYSFLTGLGLGISLLFKQVALPLLLIVVFYKFFFDGKKTNLTFFVLGASIPLLYLLYFILANNILENFVYWTVTFNLTVFSQFGRKLPSVSELIKSSPVFVLASALIVVYVIFIFKKIKGLHSYLELYDSKDFFPFPTKNKISKFGTSNKKTEFALNMVVAGGNLTSKPIDFHYLVIFYFSLLVFAYARFDYVHLQPSLPFALMIIVFLINKIKIGKNLIYYIFTLISLFIAVKFTPFLLGDRILFYSSEELETSAKVLKYANRGDSVFSFGTLPSIYQMTQTTPPGNKFVFQFPWFMMVCEKNILDGIISDNPKVIVRDSYSTVSGINLVNSMPKISEYISQNYYKIEEINGLDLMIKKNK